jgi:large subunit ribosomal protein L21
MELYREGLHQRLLRIQYNAGSLRVDTNKENRFKMFAVIKSGGRQYKVSVGETLEVNRLPADDGEQITFDEVLLISDENGAMIGTPFVANASVLATAVERTRGEKLIVFKYKAKKRIRHKRGHRQELTLLSIDDIVANGKSLITGNAPQAKAAPVEEDDNDFEADLEATETPADREASTEQRTSRRRRTSNVEDTESETEE